MNKYDVEIYIRPTCLDCQELKKYLRDNEISFHAKTVENNSIFEKELIALTGSRIVPVLVFTTNSFF